MCEQRSKRERRSQPTPLIWQADKGDLPQKIPRDVGRFDLGDDWVFVQAACWEMCQMALDFGEESGCFNLPRGMDAKKDKKSNLNKLHNSAVNFQCWRWTFNSSQYIYKAKRVLSIFVPQEIAIQKEIPWKSTCSMVNVDAL